MIHHSSNIVRTVAASLVTLGLVGVAGPAAAQQGGAEADSEKREKADKRDGEQLSEKEREVARLITKAQKAYHGGHWYEAQMRYRDAFDGAPEDSQMKVHAAVGLSSLLWQRGNVGQAREIIDVALERARKLDMNDAIGRLLLTLGHIQGGQGQLATAEQTLKACVKLAGGQKDKVFGPLCKLNWRLVRKMQGKEAGSKQDYKATIAELKSVDTPLTVGMALSKTADLYAKSGRMSRAFNLLSEAGRQYAKAKSVPAQARNDLNMARLLQNAGKWNQARAKLKGLVAKFRQMGGKPALVQTLGLLGNDAKKRGKLGIAHKFYSESLRVAREIGSPQIVAKARLSLCHLSAESPKMVGEEQCTQAAEAFEKLGVPRLRAKSLAAHARRQQAVGDMKAARKSYIDAVEVLREQVHASLHGDVLASHLTNLCQVERQLKVEGAFYRCRKALEAIDRVDGKRPAMRAAAHHAAGVAAGREGKPEPGIEHLSKAIELYTSDKLDEPASLADARLNHGALLAETGEYEAAEKEFAAALKDIGGAEEYRSARIQIRIQYAQTLLAHKKWKAGAEQLEKLVDAAREADDDDTHSWALTALARARVNLDDEDAAKTALQKALPLAKKAGAEGRVKRIEQNLKQFE